MKVLELLEEIEEIVDTASGFPLTGKIMVEMCIRDRKKGIIIQRLPIWDAEPELWQMPMTQRDRWWAVEAI